MHINREACIGCETCLAWCPVQAIHMRGDRADIDRDLCTECGNCAREGVVQCPVDCFSVDKLQWPRTVRRFFSDPMATHEETGIPGRGTEESKTNDVTGRIGRGEVGLALEMGRPHVAARGRDIDIMTRALASRGVRFEQDNPLTYLMVDRKRGALDPQLMDVRVISAIIEFVIPRKRLAEVLRLILQKADEIDTVFSLDLAVRFNEDGCLPRLAQLQEFDLQPYPNAKINLGLGRPLAKE